MKSNNNTISLVVPVYNVKEYIHACVNSLLAQTYSDFELILVNDGSTDESGLICDEYAMLDERIKVIHQNNLGVSFARNEGLRHATGGYVAFIDSDDLVLPDYLKVLKSCIDKTNADIVKCDIKQFIEDDEVSAFESFVNIPFIKTPKQDLLDILYCKGVGRWSGPGAKLYKAVLIQDMLFDVTMAYDEDFDFLYNAVKKAKKITTIQYAGYMYRVRPGSATQSGFNPKMLDSIEKRFAKSEKDKDIARAQRTNIVLNSIHRLSLISSQTKKFKNEQDRLWNIILKLRKEALYDKLQRIDHKTSTAASYLGRRFVVQSIRIVKKIKLAPEE